MNAFRIVFAFEFMRTVGRRAFWLGTFATPLIVLVFAVISTVAGSVGANEEARDAAPFVYVDDSGLVDEAIAASLGGQAATGAAAAMDAVLAGRAPAYVHYPADPGSEPIAVATGPAVSGIANPYGSLAEQALRASVEATLDDPVAAAVLSGRVPVIQAAYLADGSLDTTANAAPVGLVLFVLLVLVLMLSSSTVLVSTTEEKENRVAEVLLTTTRPLAVISAKLTALAAAALLQLVVLVAFGALVLLALRDSPIAAALPLERIVVEPQMVAVGVVLLTLGAGLLIATMALIGTMSPSAKDAGNFTVFAILLPMLPVMLLGVVLAEPDGALSTVLTFVPWTAGTTALLRNAFGALPLADAVLVAAILATVLVATVALTVRAFRVGALEYTRMLGVRDLLGR